MIWTINTSLKQRKKDEYNKQMSSYGVVALLYLIKEYEIDENFEECILIKSVIDDANNNLLKGCPLQLPTTLVGLNVRRFLESNYEKVFGGKFTADAFFINLDYYLEQIKLSIERLNK